MDADDTSKLSLADRLRIAGHVAPHARGATPKRAKPIKVVSGDPLSATRLTDLPARDVTHEELEEKLLVRAGIELDVEPDSSLCVVCRKAATELSAKYARLRGHNAYCAEHLQTATKRRKPPLPCTICREPSTVQSSRNARSHGTAAYCAAHARHQGRRSKPLPHCSVEACGRLSTRASAKNVRKRGGSPYCEKHKGGANARKLIPPCAVRDCPNFATMESAKSARNRGTLPYCKDHPRGKGST